MRPSVTAHRYAQAAFEVSREDNATARWLQDLVRARDALTKSDVSQYFRDPAISGEEKLRAVETLVPGLHPHVLNLVKTLVARRRLILLSSITDEFSSLEREARGLSEAQVTVARPLTPAETDDIARRIGSMTGTTVEVKTVVDPSILGGVVVRIGDRLFDASVSGRLERLRQEIAV